MKPACLPYDYDFGLDEESQLDPAGTEVRDMLKIKVHRVDRNKSALSQVRIETFKGSRSIESGAKPWRPSGHFTGWLSDAHLSTTGEARAVVPWRPGG